MTADRHRTTVSVVIPARNAADDIGACLAAVSRSDWPVLEYIVVDDASTDRTAQAAEAGGARVLRLAERCGPGVARNRGARLATGDILLFLDADVVVHTDAIGRAVRALALDSSVAAVFGSYDDRPSRGGRISRYRNLLHHWTHQRGAEEASTFWAGCGAVRREVFLSLGGFSADYDRPSVEDIEFGYRLRAAGYRIRLLKDMQGTHLKHWKLLDILRTDLLRRGVPWVKLLRRYRDAPRDLNIDRATRVATSLAAVFLVSTALSIPGHPLSLPPWPAVLAAVATLAGIFWIRRSFFRFLWVRHGPVDVLVAAPMQLLYFITCGLAVLLGFLGRPFGPQRRA
jgi:glycosyltransferase involved in cell wall biosynthesis